MKSTSKSRQPYEYTQTNYYSLDIAQAFTHHLFDSVLYLGLR